MNVYLTLCITVCLAVLFVITLVGVLVGNLALGLLRRFQANWLLRSPSLLFSIRMFPFLLGAMTTFAFVLPSFLLLEPKQTPETAEPHLWLLSGLAAVALGAVAVRWIRLMYQTIRTSREWLRTGWRIEIPTVSVPVYAIDTPESLVAVTGIFRTRVFVGRQAWASLTEEELVAAVAHELAHVRSFDNLKQLLLRITRLPNCFAHLGWSESAWSDSAEFAADREALQRGGSPVDLASALVKVSRLKTCDGANALAACHLIPVQHGSAVALRVRYLQEVLAAVPQSTPQAPQGLLLLAAAAACTTYLVALPVALPLTHRAIEWLVR